jgi:nucleolar MIF4G domain-containing protein 1
MAKSQRMNTDVRKAVFKALLSSVDYLDAFNRLVRLKLSSKQEREIILVILHCVSRVLF